MRLWCTYFCRFSTLGYRYLFFVVRDSEEQWTVHQQTFLLVRTAPISLNGKIISAGTSCHIKAHNSGALKRTATKHSTEMMYSKGICWYIVLVYKKELEGESRHAPTVAAHPRIPQSTANLQIEGTRYLYHQAKHIRLFHQPFPQALHSTHLEPSKVRLLQISGITTVRPALLAHLALQINW